MLEGGNQSGKTWSSCVDFLLQARGLHQFRKWMPTRTGDSWRGWYATTTYERFAEQAWGHWKSLILLPGESVHRLPTRNILAIGWDNKNPERPLYLKIRRNDSRDCVSEVWIKSYEQGAAEFQSAEVDCLALDEECPNDVYEESQPRIMKRSGAIQISATPVRGVRWLEDLRAAAERDSGLAVSHHRLDTRDNPGMPPDQVKLLEEKWAVRTELRDLRLRGLPVAAAGSVYTDLQFTPQHICDPFDIPSEWTRYRTIDHGWRCCACLWFAVSPAEEVILYREYVGEERTIAQNTAAIAHLSGGEQYQSTWIDPATLGTDAGTGRRVIDIWIDGFKEAVRDGVPVIPAPDNDVMAGIEQVWNLLDKRRSDGLPSFRVFRTCGHFLDERRSYRFNSTRAKGDEGALKPVKREDHAMDAFRYFVAAGARFQRLPSRPPREGSLARRLWERRHAKEMAGRRRL